MSRHQSTAAPAGCRAALWSAGGCFCCQRLGGCLPFWVPEMQGGRARRRGWRCCRWRPGRRGDGLPGMAAAGNGPAAICGGNSEVFNQQLTTFLVIAMVWWLSVFFLCSYRQFRRCWRLFRSPGAGRCWEVSGVVWGGWLLDQGMGGVAEKGTVLLRMGVEYCPTSSPPLHGIWGWRKTGRGSFCNPGLK